MPTVTGTTTSIQMADPINHSALVFSTGLGGTSSTAFSRQNVSAGTTWSFQGTGFGGYSGGIPSFGTVTSVTVSGATSVTITGLSFPVASFFSLDQFELLEAVFAGADTINGSSTGDSLTGYGGTNAIFGNDGDDLLQSLGVADILDGGNGQDRLVLERTSAAGVTLALTGMDTNTGITLADGTTIRNVEGFMVTTGSGADTLSFAGAITGLNTFDAGAGVDRVIIDLTGTTDNWSMGLGGVVSQFGSPVLFMSGVEAVQYTGGSGSDSLSGGALNDTLVGGDGNDAILTGAGVDIVDGGAGIDTLEFDRGATTVALILNTGDLTTNAGVTLADGSVIRNIEHYRITSGSGADTFNITTLPAIIPLGASFIDGGAGFDTLTGDFSSSTTPVNHHLFWFNFESVHVIGGSAGDTLNGGAVDSDLQGGAGDDVLSGSAAGVDLLDGGAGFDRVNVGLGSVTSDVVFTLQNFDTPTGVTFVNGTNVRNAESIFILAGSGNDTLDLGTAFSGSHGFNGGVGFDTVIADFTGSSVRVDTGPEFIRWGFTNSVLLAGVERYVITGGSGEDSLVGSRTAVANDILNGGAGNDVLAGYLGDDILNGGDGDDDFIMHSGADQIDGGAGNDRLNFLLDASQTSVSQTFQLSDFIGVNTVDGAHFASGAVVRNMETLWAELGDANDTVIVNTDLHVRTEIWAHGGFDVLQLDLSGETRAVTFTMKAPTEWSPITFDSQPVQFWVGAVEQLVATLGSGADTVTGGDNNDTINGGAGTDNIQGGPGADSLDGGAGGDTLDGGAGADTMAGGDGNDTYFVDNAGDVTTEASAAGLDHVHAAVTRSLGANLENLTLTGATAISGFGNALDNIITGNGAANQLNGFDGNDTLNGGGGADLMFGGNGDDTYVVDNAGDVTSEVSALGGVDTVLSSVTRNLTANIENLTLTGAAAITGAGNALNNVILGNSGANTLYGFDGNDRLDGGLGADTLFGASGDDTYVVDNVGDITVEGSALGGIDTVESSISRNLNANFENLVLTGSAQLGYGNVLNNVMTGNAAANGLYGFDGNDRLDGGAGADQMFGANGDDTYVVDDAGDVTSEVSALGGVDTVLSSVTRNLTANLENLTLTGDAAITGAGNALDNSITGNAAANTLFGLDGNDTLDGGLGADTLQGGAGEDAYVFRSALGAGNVDAVMNFNVADDVIQLDSAVFAGLTEGTLDAGAFHIGAAATEAAHRIVYDSATGALWFDADGSGAGAAIQFAALAAGLSLTNDDIFVIGP